VKKSSIIITAVILMLLLATILVACSLQKKTPEPTPTQDSTPWLFTSLPTVGDLAASPTADLSTALPTVPLPTPTSDALILTAPTAAPTVQMIAPTPTQSYPIYAQDVVKAFLSAAPDQMSAYLSAAARANLPASGTLGFLMVTNPVQSFTVQSTSVSEASGGAVVLVQMEADGIQTIRIFNLIVENGVWVIHSVDIARG